MNKFEMEAVLSEDNTLEMGAGCNGATGAEIIKVLSETVNYIAERLRLDKSERNYFFNEVVYSILNMREEYEDEQ